MNKEFTAGDTASSIIQPWLVAEFILIVLVTVVVAGGFLNHEILNDNDELFAQEGLHIDVSLIMFIALLVYKVFEFPVSTLLFEVRIVVSVSPIS